jgi:hypothetical protein
MGQLFTRARAEAWRAAQPHARHLADLARAARRAETACLTGLCLLLAAAAYLN